MAVDAEREQPVGVGQLDAAEADVVAVMDVEPERALAAAFAVSGRTGDDDVAQASPSPPTPACRGVSALCERSGSRAHLRAATSNAYRR